MRKFKYIGLFLVLSTIISCSNDDEASGIKDEISEFVFFTTTQLSMNEAENSTAGNEIEIHVQMLAVPRDIDIVVTLEVTGQNAEAGVDYEVASAENTIVIPAGETASTEGFKLRTVNNTLSSTEDRKVNVSISSTTDDELRIGRGISNPENAMVEVTITDDECSDSISIFNNAEWSFEGSNTVYYSEYTGSFSTAVVGDQITISGDIANYDVGITVTGTLVPNPDAPTTGTIEFDDSSVGNDGTYDYRWIFSEDGTYDICARTLQLSTLLQYTDVFGPDPSAWVDWYVSTISANITSEGGEGAMPPSGSVLEVISAMADEDFTITGTLTDVQGLSGITLQNMELAIDQTITLGGETMYDLNETFTVPTGTADGDYPIEIMATNIEGLSTTFSSVLTVTSSAGCTSDFTVFGDVSLTANASITETDGSFDPYDFSKDVTTTISGDQITIAGDLIDFFETQLTVTMVPDSVDSTVGVVNFTEENLGEHTDGFTYRLVQEQEGAYDACSGTMNVYYNLEYDDGAGNWILYYKVATEFSL